jgi:hypothetical protein
MKSLLSILLLAIFTGGLYASDVPGYSDTLYPTLSSQLDSMRQSFQPQIDYRKAVDNLTDYLASTNREFPADMAIVLQPGYYENCLASRNAPIAVDGEISDWNRVTFRASDPTGDGFGTAGNDVVEIAFAIDVNDNAELLIRTSGRPLKNQTFYVLFDYDLDWNYETEAIFFWWTDGKLYMRSIDLVHGNATKHIPAQTALPFSRRSSSMTPPAPSPTQPVFRRPLSTSIYTARPIDTTCPAPQLRPQILLCPNALRKNDHAMALALANRFIRVRDEPERASRCEHTRFHTYLRTAPCATITNPTAPSTRKVLHNVTKLSSVRNPPSKPRTAQRSHFATTKSQTTELRSESPWRPSHEASPN